MTPRGLTAQGPGGERTGVRFGVLGTVEAWCGQAPVDLGHARQRLVLAALLLDAGRPVPAGELTDRVWGQDPPRRGRDALYGYLSRLRQALAGTGADIVRGPGGYLLTAPQEAVDVFRFRELAGRARAAGADGRAAPLWEEALGLWRGEAFAGADTEWCNAQRAVLDAERLAARLDLADVRLGLGQHAPLLAELTARAREHPLDERVAGQLMLALYRCGRQAEALEAYERVRRRLAEDTGVDPQAPLRRLHQRILTADPALDLPRDEPPAAPAAAPARPVPRQLPAAPAGFVGRCRELAALDGLLKRRDDADRGPGIAAVGGTGGTGKTWLALRWAHDHLDRFPDGQLYADLRGFDPSAAPIPARTVLRTFLDALGVDARAVPAEPDAQAGLYRTLVADRALLIVLDNARDADHVRPLLPGGATCTVLVTSRSRLDGLTTTHGAQYLSLGALRDEEARQVLHQGLGADRMAAEPAAVSAVLRRCAGLPLALGIVAGRAAARPGFPLAALAEELDEAATRLDALSTGDLTTDLRAVLETSHRALDEDAARVFALRGLVPGPEIGLPAAAALTGLPLPRARVLLRTLEAAHLVEEHTPGRYRMPDLVRLYAAERGRELPDAVGVPALRRLTDFHLHTARAGDRVLSPHRVPMEPEEADPGCTPLAFPDAAAALAWFDTEHPCLLSVQRLALNRGWAMRAWYAAWALDPYHRNRGHFRDLVATWHTAIAAVEGLPDPRPLAWAYQHLGVAYAETESAGAALHHFNLALKLFQRAGDAAGEARTHQGTALAWDRSCAPERALPHLRRALRLYRLLADARSEAETLNATGRSHARLGDFARAETFCGQALAIQRRTGDRDGEAATLDTLAYTAHRAGRHTEALDHYGRALALSRELGNAIAEADWLTHLGEIHQALGHREKARRAWEQAAALYRDQHRPAEAQRVRAVLSALDRDPA